LEHITLNPLFVVGLDVNEPSPQFLFYEGAGHTSSFLRGTAA
jgi:hypothetical protein